MASFVTDGRLRVPRADSGQGPEAGRSGVNSGGSPEMRALVREIEKVAAHDVSVSMQGGAA
jgi:DNA-binding NtrC family response regulator